MELHTKILKSKLEEGEDIFEYVTQIENIKKEIKEAGLKELDDDLVVSIISNGLPPSYKKILEMLEVEK